MDCIAQCIRKFADCIQQGSMNTEYILCQQVFIPSTAHEQAFSNSVTDKLYPQTVAVFSEESIFSGMPNTWILTGGACSMASHIFPTKASAEVSFGKSTEFSQSFKIGLSVVFIWMTECGDQSNG